MIPSGKQQQHGMALVPFLRLHSPETYGWLCRLRLLCVLQGTGDDAAASILLFSPFAPIIRHMRSAIQLIVLLAALGAACQVGAGFIQAPTQQLAFEAASVRLSTSPNDGFADFDTTPGTLTIRNYTLRAIIRTAYQAKDYQISGGPKWLNHDRYDINAKADSPAKPPQLFLMLQALLAERFKLVVHRESRDFQGYALVIAKSGLKLKAVGSDTDRSINSRPGVITAKATSLTLLSQWLARILNAPVQDSTGISDVFDFKLEWTPDGAPQAGEAPGPSIFAALQDQLGLKLEPHKTPLEMIVVDSAERASEN